MLHSHQQSPGCSPKAVLGRFATAALLACGLASCALVPRQQLAEFAGSFEEAREAGLLVYEQLVEPIRAEEGRQTNVAYPITLGPERLRASVCEARFGGIASLVARCHAFAAATAYNSSLLALARGARAEATLARLDTALGAVGSLAAAAAVNPVVAALKTPALGALQGILGEALTISDRLRLKEKLDQGAPIVSDLVAALQEDAGRVHAVARGYYVTRLDTAENEALRVLDDLFPLVSGRAPPTSDDTLALFEAASERVDRLIGRPEPAINPPRLGILLSAGGRPIEAADVAALTRAAAPLEAAYARFDAVAREWEPVRGSIDAYARMLDNVKEALAELVAASDDPFSAGGATVQIAETILGIRERARDIREQIGD